MAYEQRELGGGREGRGGRGDGGQGGEGGGNEGGFPRGRGRRKLISPRCPRSCGLEIAQGAIPERETDHTVDYTDHP
jgi:hypothetical protein